LIKRPGVDVMTTIFYFSTIFDNFRRKDWRFSQKNMLCMIKFLRKLAVVLSKERQSFRQIFLQTYFWNHNIGPRLRELNWSLEQGDQIGRIFTQLEIVL
jgi:hypothetical protein